jgi:hypothetical protein
MGKGGAPDIRNEREALVMGFFIIGIGGIVMAGMAIEAQFPADCGLSKQLWRAGAAHPPLSREEFLTIASNCTLSPLAEHPPRTYWIRHDERPCRSEHVLNAYPAPKCKRGKVARAVYPGRRRGRPGQREQITMQTLCCTVSAADDGGNDGLRHASTQTYGNERNDGDL